MPYSELDSRRFGKRIHRVLVEEPAQVEPAIAACRAEGAELVIARCPVATAATAQALERAGFALCDTLVYYAGPTARFVAPPSLPGVRIGAFSPSDLAPLEAVARAAFTDYAGHYHADPRLDRAAATEGYVEWFTSATRDPTMHVLVATLGHEPVGFLTLRRGAEIVLNGVAPAAQGRGIYDGLVKAAGFFACEQDDTELLVSTHLQNLAPQRVWVRNGLEPRRGFYTFHGWL
jgi:hypothetical protein